VAGQGGPWQASARRPADVSQVIGEIAPAYGQSEKRTESECCQTFDGDAQISGHQLHAARNQDRHTHIAADVDKDNCRDL